MDRLQGEFAPPGGQSINDVRDEMRDYFGSLIPTPGVDRPDHVWAFTHGVAIKAFVGGLNNWSYEHIIHTWIDTLLLPVLLDSMASGV